MKALFAGTALLALGAAAAVAAPAPAFLAPPAACVQAAGPAAAPPFALAKGLEGAPAPQVKTICPDAFCSSVDDCYQACPAAPASITYCTGGFCYYYWPPPGGGGGGSGGTGPHFDCATDPCMDSSTCGTCNGRVGVCDPSGTCQY